MEQFDWSECYNHGTSENYYLSRFNVVVFSSALTNLGTLFSVILGLHPNLSIRDRFIINHNNIIAHVNNNNVASTELQCTITDTKLIVLLYPCTL